MGQSAFASRLATQPVGCITLEQIAREVVRRALKAIAETVADK